MRRKDSTGRILKLRRETLRRLALRDRDLRRVAGGTYDAPYDQTGGYDPTDTQKPDLWEHDTMSTVSRYC